MSYVHCLALHNLNLQVTKDASPSYVSSQYFLTQIGVA